MTDTFYACLSSTVLNAALFDALQSVSAACGTTDDQRSTDHWAPPSNLINASVDALMARNWSQPS